MEWGRGILESTRCIIQAILLLYLTLRCLCFSGIDVPNVSQLHVLSVVAGWRSSEERSLIKSMPLANTVKQTFPLLVDEPRLLSSAVPLKIVQNQLLCRPKHSRSAERNFGIICVDVVAYSSSQAAASFAGFARRTRAMTAHVSQRCCAALGRPGSREQPSLQELFYEWHSSAQ
eukprot:873559-Amphidinium_carterae.2